MSSKLHKKVKNKNINEINIEYKVKRKKVLKLLLFISIFFILCWLGFTLYIYSNYHNELGEKVLRCDNFSTIYMDNNGVFTWNFDNKINDNLKGVINIYFGDNAIDFISKNENVYNLSIDEINSFFDGVDYKKEDFFAMKINSFIYDSTESELGNFDGVGSVYYFGFELDNNRLQAINVKENRIRLFEYVE